MDARLREILVANLFDGDDSGTVTAPIAALVDDIVVALAEQGYTVARSDAPSSLAEALEAARAAIASDQQVSAPDLRAADGRAALVRIMDRTQDESIYADCDVAYKTIDALDAHRCIPDEATLAGGRDIEVERELRKRLTRHHRDEHVTAATCRSCAAALREAQP